MTAALAAAAYANSLRNGFVWDDPIILERQLVVFRSIGDVLLPPQGIPQFSPDYYRPIVILSYLLDRAVGGEHPFVYHLSVVLTHVAASVLVCWVALRVFAGVPLARFGAAVAGAAFAVHPVHTESVAWAAGRSDVLATCFLLLAFAIHLRERIEGWHVLLAGIFTAAALGSKETAITIFPLLLAYDLLLRSAPRTQHPLVRWAGPLAAGVAYSFLRLAALGDAIGSAPGGTAGIHSVVAPIGAIGVYLGKLSWPVSLNAYIDRVPTDATALLLTAGILIATIALAIVLARRNDKIPAFLVFWTLITLMPSLAIVWKIPDAPVAERYLYLPSVGFCLLLGYAATGARSFRRTAAARNAVIAATAALVAAGLLATASRNRVWYDNLSLWSDTAQKSTRSGMALRSLAATHQKAGRFDEARRHFQLALARENDPAGQLIIYNNLGTLAMQTGDYRAAADHYRRAREIAPTAPDTLFNLGLAVFQAGGGTPHAAREAIRHYAQAEELSPHDPDVQAGLGQAWLAAGDRERAVAHFRRALELQVRPDTAASIRSFLEQ